MSRDKKYSPEQIVSLPRQIEMQIANRMTHAVACRKFASHEQSTQTPKPTISDVRRTSRFHEIVGGN